MTDNYAKTLVDYEFPSDDIFDSERQLTENAELAKALSDPSVSADEKGRVIDSIFPHSTRGFIKLLCKRGDIDRIREIVSEYKSLLDKKDGIIRATLVCVTPPDEKQLEGIRDFLCRRFGGKTAEVEIIRDDSLIGGFILNACGVEFDRSLRSSIDDLKNKMTKSV